MNRSKSESGIALMNVMIASAVGTIVAASFVSMMLSQQRMTKQLAQRYEILDLKQNLLTVFRDPTVCNANLRPSATLSDASNPSFDARTWDDIATEADETDGRLTFAALKAGTSPTAQTLVAVGQPVQGTQTGLVVESIKLKNLRPLDPGLPANLRLVWLGVFEIGFRSDTLVSALRPLQISQSFRVVDDATESPESARKVDNCLGTGGDFQRFGGVYSNTNSGCDIAMNPFTGAQSCPPGFFPVDLYVGMWVPKTGCPGPFDQKTIYICLR